MVRNVRWLYNKLGTTDFSNVGGGTVTGALSSLQTELSGKADSTHSHTTGDLPVTNSLSTNSASYIPSSSAVYSLQSIINDLNTEIQNINDQFDPNNREYNSTRIDTWSSASDVDTFLSRFNHDNLYKDGDTELALGNIIYIEDGRYDKEWKIAGFDMEYNQLAADGTIYDNGYGICLIPASTPVTTGNWGSSATGGYISSTTHTYTLPTVTNRLRNDILGSHIVNRNVLLSSGTSGSLSLGGGGSSAYTWTTSYATLMSVGQLTGEFASHSNKYDDGEANYKLPLFDHETFYTNYEGSWLRNILGVGAADGNSYCYLVGSSSNPIRTGVIGGSTSAIKPLIYIR